MNPINVFRGWFYSLIYAPKNAQRMSKERLDDCRICTNVQESKVLQFIKGNAIETNTLVCKCCGCPIKEKSLVKSETCCLNKWKR